jgi:TonB family protein
MNIPEEFGKYLLLKKLTEDALGETFRAGRVGRDGIEQVVLLRVFNGPGMDGEQLWQRIAGRGVVQQALRSPNIGSGVDLSRVRSFPYVAYDYISGKNLAALLAEAARQHMPIPPDHALLIGERIAMALMAAYETRVGDERVLHGFVVPHLVMVSNEGEARLLGFEAAPGLRDLHAGGWSSPDLSPYLAPEAGAGAPAPGQSAAAGAAAPPPNRSEDVYSLGAILFQLLTGYAPPSGAPDQMAAAIDGAVSAHDESPLPPALAALLTRSLVAREGRIADAVTWHKAISKLMIEGHYSSTTFNLAFFMHNLFRDEIERESQEIQAEKRLELPHRAAAEAAPGGTGGGFGGGLGGGAGAAAAAGAGAAGGFAGAHVEARAAGTPADMREVTGVREATWPGSKAQAAAPAAKSKSALWLGLGAAALVLLAVGGYFALGRGGGKPAGPAPARAALAQPAPAAPTAAELAKQQADMQAQIQQMIAAQSKDVESRLKTQYDDQIKQLQKKLEDSRKANTEGRAERAAPPSSGASSAAAQAAETKTAAGRYEPPQAPSAAGISAPVPAVPAAQGQTAAERAAASPSAGAPGGNAPAGGGAAGGSAALGPGVPGAPTAAPAEGARLPQVQMGDLVSFGPGVSQPKLLSRPAALYPVMARRMNRTSEVTVTVKVLVDERGRVLEAERIGSPVGYGFDEAAVDSARHANYTAATKDGVHVKMWVPLKVEFKPRQ